MRSIPLLCLLLTACGVPFHPAHETTAGGLTVYWEGQPHDLSTLVQEARAAVPGPHPTLWIHASTKFKCGDLTVDGCAVWPDSVDVQLASSGGALLHEMFHLIDSNSPQDSAKHLHWEDRGWAQAGDEFDQHWSNGIHSAKGI